MKTKKRFYAPFEKKRPTRNPRSPKIPGIGIRGARAKNNFLALFLTTFLRSKKESILTRNFVCFCFEGLQNKNEFFFRFFSFFSATTTTTPHHTTRQPDNNSNNSDNPPPCAKKRDSRRRPSRTNKRTESPWTIFPNKKRNRRRQRKKSRAPSTALAPRETPRT